MISGFKIQKCSVNKDATPTVPFGLITPTTAPYPAVTERFTASAKRGWNIHALPSNLPVGGVCGLFLRAVIQFPQWCTTLLGKQRFYFCRRRRRWAQMQLRIILWSLLRRVGGKKHIWEGWFSAFVCWFALPRFARVAPTWVDADETPIKSKCFAYNLTNTAPLILCPCRAALTFLNRLSLVDAFAWAQSACECCPGVRWLVNGF